LLVHLVVSSHGEERSRSRISEAFRHLAHGASATLGTHWAFLVALLLVIGWGVTGPFFDFAETWQLIINTATTILTFLMVFLIQSTQNRDAKAIHLKLDELIRSSKARNVFAALEYASEDELDRFEHEFEELRAAGLHKDDAAVAAHERIQSTRP
jgi:low affinity Fe/Cu permease